MGRLVAAFFFLFSSFGSGAEVDSRCWSLAALAREDRLLAERILLEALDSEGLYTIVGGIKPLSDAIHARQLSSDPAKADEERSAIRRAVKALRCGEIEFFVAFGDATPEQPATAEPYVVHHRRFRETILRHREFFSRLGVDETVAPYAVLDRLQHVSSTDVNEAYGYLLGFPPYAARFFARAHRVEGGRFLGFLARRFVRIPTHGASSPKHAFVYAAPSRPPTHPDDEALLARCRPIHEAYEARRARMVNRGEDGPTKLLLEWMRESPLLFEPPSGCPARLVTGQI